MNFFTSDPHYGHEKIIGYCDRPFSDLLEMRHELVRRWNLLVKPSDTVYVLGDFALYLRKAEVEELLAELNGTKHLRKGNHDHRDTYKAVGWASTDGYSELGFSNGWNVHLLHDPNRVDLYNPDAVGIVLHGHLHGGKGLRERPQVHPHRVFLDVGVDVDFHDYSPISEPEIIHLINRRAIDD